MNQQVAIKVKEVKIELSTTYQKDGKEAHVYIELVARSNGSYEINTNRGSNAGFVFKAFHHGEAEKQKAVAKLIEEALYHLETLTW